MNNGSPNDFYQKRRWLDSVMRETKWSSDYARAAFYAAGFGLICAFTLTIFTGSYNGACYGLVFGVLFGGAFAVLSRYIARRIGEGGILWYGFAGIISGGVCGALAKMICSPIASEVLTKVYGRIDHPPQMAFYAVVCAAYLGGFFGLFQSLIFGKKVNLEEVGFERRDKASSLTKHAAVMPAALTETTTRSR
jgi:hypothetical protein